MIETKFIKTLSRPFTFPVIPAKAGIHLPDNAAEKVDPGLRRGDGGKESYKQQGGRERGKPYRRLTYTPPHLPVLTLKLPHDKGLRQSEIRSLEPSR
jgi:hypothetical protein